MMRTVTKNTDEFGRECPVEHLDDLRPVGSVCVSDRPFCEIIPSSFLYGRYVYGKVVRTSLLPTLSKTANNQSVQFRLMTTVWFRFSRDTSTTVPVGGATLLLGSCWAVVRPT